jgi:nitrogen fixation/metabolism regulation signal transduction histidine kinase
VERPEITVSTGALVMTDGAPAVRLQVRDNGTGFAPAMLARAFEPYVTTKTRGTGLGLAIVRKIVDEHHARIDLGNWTDEEGGVAGGQVAILFTKLAKTGENDQLASATQRRDGANG